MRNKINYIVGGFMALFFSITAATGVCELLGWPLEATWIPQAAAMALHDWFRRIHIIVGLILIIFVIFHIIRNWHWIAGMTEALREEREKTTAEDLFEDDEVAPDTGSGTEVPIDVIDEDEFVDEDEDEEPPEPLESDEKDNGDDDDNQGKKGRKGKK